MIKNSIIYFLILCAGYTFVIDLIDHTKVRAQNQWQENASRAEKYIYYNGDVEGVIVGTSLSARLNMKDFNWKFHNLSFSGQSAYDGLDIVTRAHTKPKTVYIEINILFVELHKDFTDPLFNPALSIAKNNIKILRVSNQPASVIGSAQYVDAKLNKAISFYNSLMRSLTHGIKEGMPSDAFDFMLNRHAETYTKLPSEENVKKYIEMLKGYVDKLKQKNTRVVFFEMPVHEKLINLKRAVEIRREISENFPDDMFIPQPDCQDYETTDGHHLNNESMAKYTKYFRNYVSVQSGPAIGSVVP